MTEQEDVNGNDPTIVAPAAGSIFPANCIESLRQQNSRTVALLLEAGALLQEALANQLRRRFSKPPPEQHSGQAVP
jgi:hypothetical protein